MIWDSTTWHKCPDCGKRYDWANEDGKCPHLLLSRRVGPKDTPPGAEEVETYRAAQEQKR